MPKKILEYSAIFALASGLVLYIFTAIYIGNRVYFDNKVKSDVIIVLGARSYVNGKINQCVEARVRHAVDLYNDGYAKKIIMSGGTDKKPVFQDTNEGEEMKKMALSIDSGLNEEDILIEGESTSTFENLAYSKEIMSKNGLITAIITTEPYHSPRANLIARKLELNYTVSPTMTSHCWNNWKYLSTQFLREPLVLIGYKILNQI